MLRYRLEGDDELKPYVLLASRLGDDEDSNWPMSRTMTGVVCYGASKDRLSSHCRPATRTAPTASGAAPSAASK